MANADAQRLMKPFVDTCSDCAICLCPLDDDDDHPSKNETTTANVMCPTTTTPARTIRLACGHRWHLACLQEQLRHARPNHARRLLFGGCRCAKCGTFCDDHRELLATTESSSSNGANNNNNPRTDVLRRRVDELISDQLAVDVPGTWSVATAADRAKLIEEGRRTYAFYLCQSCNEPYFGGTIECADQAEGELPPDDRLCPSCAPAIQNACRKSLQHLGHHVYKCRYCCRPSEFVCYGTVHFCQPCHDRNSARVHAQQQQGRRWIASCSSDPPPLEAIPCPGGNDCIFPKPQGKDKHENGPSPSCEQVYHCALCMSTPTTTGSEAAYHMEPGSRNLVVNPCGQSQLHGWNHLSRRSRWTVETSETPLNDGTSTNFVSTFDWCVMTQLIPIHQFVRQPSSVRVELSCHYMGRTDCPSVFVLEGFVRDAQGQVLRRAHTPPLVAPADFWERVSVILEPTHGAHDVLMVVRGKDSNFWRGNFGSKVTDCSVRVLCPLDEIENILLPGM